MFGVQKILMSFMCQSCTKQQQRFIERSPSPFRCRCPQGILMWRPAAPWRLAQQSYHSESQNASWLSKMYPLDQLHFPCNMQCRSKWNGMMMPTLGHFSTMPRCSKRETLSICPLDRCRSALGYRWRRGFLRAGKGVVGFFRSEKPQESWDENEFRRHKQFDVIDTM